MRAAAVGVVIAACAAPVRAPRHADDVAHRRALLERSLVNRDNAYAQVRLAHYGRDWETLPVWNPRVAAHDFDGPTTTSSSTAPAATRSLALDSPSLGEEAFFRYPVQIVPALASVRSREEAAAYGLENVVRVELEHGDHALAVTCATCHTRRERSSLVVGAANARLDLGRLLADVDGSNAARRGWGPGRLDVTTARGDEVVRIPDLRPMRFLTHLHHAATIASSDVETLSVRIETLIVTSNGEALRPPRAVSDSLAAYLWRLADALPMRTPATGAERHGQAIFDARCARCHVPPAFTGPPVPVAAVGTDPTVARSADRGTGMYRVPSLRGVSTRGALLHDGSARDLEGLFDDSRTTGHTYGVGLEPAARRDLLAYLRTL